MTGDFDVVPPTQDPSLILVAHDLMSKALEERCSDMHVEPEDDCVIVRYLINREPVGETKLAKGLHQELLLCFKVLAGLNVQEHGRPQDKRTMIKLGEEEVEFRVTTIPGEHGETIAISFRYPK